MALRKNKVIYIAEGENGDLYTAWDKDEAIELCEYESDEVIRVIEVHVPDEAFPPKKVYPTTIVGK